MFLAWFVLAIAIATEVCATLALKPAGDGSVPALLVSVVGYAGSLGLLLWVLKRMDVSLAYAVWAGAGTAAIALIGMTALGEPVSLLKVASIGLIIVGVVGLNLAGAA
jgi:small multidrug resistance pump